MSYFWIRNLILLALVLPSTLVFGETPQPLFAKLQVPAKQIPSECKVEEIPKDGIHDKMTNPGWTTDPTLIKNATLENTLELNQINAMFFSVYKVGDFANGGSEAGIFAWDFDTPEHAKTNAEKFAAKHQADDMKTYLKDKTLIVVWRDNDKSLSCYKAFQAQVESLVGKK